MAYIDDSYLQADTYELCVQNVIDTLSLFHQLGFVMHPDKSVLILTQRLTFLGFVLDSQSMAVAFTGEQAVKVKEACQQLLQEKAIAIQEVAKVLGLLTSSLPVVLYGPLHDRSIEMDKTQALACVSQKRPKTFRGSFWVIFSGPGKCFSKPPETARIPSERFRIFPGLAHGRHRAVIRGKERRLTKRLEV